MNLLIVQGAKLGDMVCTTPMFRHAKQNIKNMRLYVAGNALNKELLAGNPYIDEYLVLPESAAGLRRMVKEKQIDVVVVPSPNPPILKALLWRVPWIIVPHIKNGRSPYATKSYRLLSLFATRVPMYFGEYMPRAYLRLLEPLGVTVEDTKKDIFITDAARQKASTLLEGVTGPLIGISPGVGNKIKVWESGKFAAVATALSKRGTIVLLGTKTDSLEVEATKRAIDPRANILDLSEKLSVEELKAVIEKLSLFIAVDTGPIYIAEALNVPTVDIVGPMAEGEQPPIGSRHVVVVPSVRRGPAVHILNASEVNITEARRQAESIEPAQVIAAAEALLAKIG